jgi:hypothetical protein
VTSYGLEDSRRLSQAIHNHIPCGNPTCCVPPKGQPMTSPYLVFKAMALIYAIAVIVLFDLIVFFG